MMMKPMMPMNIYWRVSPMLTTVGSEAHQLYWISKE